MMGRSIVNFFRVAALLMLLITVALLSAIVTMRLVIHGAEVQVPALKGMTVVQARSETAGLGLILEVDNRYYSGEVSAGHILSQSPAPAMVVRRGWRVRVSESLGPQLVDVPDTAGEQEQFAELAVRRAGLEVGTVAELPDGLVPEGTVLAQDPPAHAEDIERPIVSLLVAAPDDGERNGWVMPGMTGWPLRSAESALTKVGIRFAPPQFVAAPVGQVGSGSEPPKLPVMPDSVIAQSPAAGMFVDQSVVVKLTVAR
jgi:beta-lactam-binding protein with PASTA domain